MFSNEFFHPDHVIPASELTGAFVKLPHFDKTEMLMELFTVFCEVLIFGNGIGDTGIHIHNSHIL